MLYMPFSGAFLPFSYSRLLLNSVIACFKGVDSLFLEGARSTAPLLHAPPIAS
nr:MAG TPA: hypothetical protein [Caudoviricetes sp.]